MKYILGLIELSTTKQEGKLMHHAHMYMFNSFS